MSGESGGQRQMPGPLARRRTDVLATVIVAGALLGMVGDPAFATDEALLVVLENHRFEPKVVHAKSGQALQFVNSDDALHSLTLIGHESVLGEEFLDPGQSYTLRIPEDLPPGTYELACTIHVDMRAQLVLSGD